MGLDDFASSGSSSSSTTNQGSGGQSSKSTSSSQSTVSDSNPMEPYFTALMDTRYETVRVFTGEKAFGRSSRHRYEDILCVIQDEDSFERLEDISQSYTDKSLEELFRTQPTKGEDLVERFQESGTQMNSVKCPICNDTIVLDQDKYTKVFGELVHGGHEVRDVVEELDED